ncbi:cytochrome aa3 quinol oxidase subunit IV [Gracilibacillus halophilus YIM-C55.5]|uniref:Quinol oxidase subunit 4 n=1 Tax=Gracilibacillus halophilus YIM-C55.5 TaxID=1308866 RepID=N4WMF6_9BACI|nr:cytochrome aa3 quinol oxidase subunit IV [Gracilibacillus halophilus]ENH95700.1 cytochrome aa3 quinol oxidase subunit IV [Gracilibacillus halophilus YIM-C55.5]
MSTQKQHRFPWNHVIGFILSIALTLLAVFVAFQTDFSSNVVLWIIGSLAIFQALIQLFLFMHITEGKEGPVNVINMIYSVFLALVIVFGSIWVLTSGHAAM